MSPRTPIDPVEAVIRFARGLKFVREVPPGSNRGPGVDDMLRACNTDVGQPWCAAFVGYVGRTMLGSAWPLPVSASCDELLRSARARGLVLPPGALPERGDVFLRLRSDTDADHTGFVTGLGAEGTFLSIEGNGNAEGGREGLGVVSNTRKLNGATRYAFVRWTAAP